MLILWIKSKSAFLSFTIWSFFWERICKKYFRKLHQSSIYISRLFWNSYFSCFLYVSSVCLHRFIFQVIKNKNNKTKQFICASVLNSSNFIILRSVDQCILFEKRLRFKPKHIHFVYSYVVYVTFPSCLRQISLLFFPLFSSSRGAWGHAVVMVNDPLFFGSEESIWSEITNPFLDSPTKTHP